MKKIILSILLISSAIFATDTKTFQNDNIETIIFDIEPIIITENENIKHIDIPVIPNIQQEKEKTKFNENFAEFKKRMDTDYMAFKNDND